MKKISLALGMLLAFSTGSMLANDIPNPSNVEDLTTQIGALLERNQLVVDEDQEIVASVLFTLNAEKEIVVLSVATENERIEAFVKSRLNYQRVTVSAGAPGDTFRVPVRIIA